MRRMGGDEPSEGWTRALADFVGELPERVHELRPAGEFVERGAAVFEQAGCKTCHAGAKYGRAGAFDVGTGGVFQVPSLLGLSARLPLMHDGCAATIQARFEPRCGGDAHGETDALSEPQRADLVAFLSSL